MNRPWRVKIEFWTGGEPEMNSVSFGDIFFISMVGGGIYFLLSLVKRSRREVEPGEETPLSYNEKNKDPAAADEGDPKQNA